MNGRVYGVAAFLLIVLLPAMALAPSAGARVTREGILRETVSENFARGESVRTYSLHSGDETTPVLLTAPVSATTGDRVIARGSMHDSTLVGTVAHADGTGGESTAALVPGGPIFIGPRKVLVLHVKFAGDPAVPWSPDAMREKIFTSTASADVYFQEESRGVISLAGKVDPENGDVSPWLTLDSPGSGCSQNAWGNEALTRASEAGLPLTGYNYFVYVFTKRPGCLWNGMATAGGNSGAIWINGNEDVQTIAHEFGHNFGLQHAGSWICTRNGARVQISNSCSTQEYGDVFDAMGNRFPRHNNGWNLAKLGMLGPANIATVTEDGTYALRAALSVSPAPTILRIPRTKDAGGNVISWYYLEIRQQGGIFENLSDATMTGVSIRATASGSSPETLLIDSNPAASTFLDAPLQVGQTFTDQHVRVTTMSAGGGSASVLVEFGDWLDWQAPSAPTGVSAAQSVGVNLEWSASADNVGVSRYVVYRNGSLIGTSPTTSFTDASPPVGLNAYTVYAEDEAGNRSPGSAPSVVTVLDLDAPSAPTNVSAIQGSGGVNLEWSASTDNVAVSRYVVSRDGSEVGAGPITVFTDSTATAGQHAYTVYAEDEAGNRSPGSAPAPVTVVDLAGPIPPSDESDSKKEKVPSRMKPALRWKRRPKGAFAFEVDAGRNAGVARVSLWLDGKLLRSKKGRILRLIWQPPVVGCARVYRFSARAYERIAGGKIVATARTRSLRLPEPAGKCRP